MLRTCIFGLPKTGTTGLYGLVKSAMKIADPDTLCAFEPPGPGVFRNAFAHALERVSFLTKAMVRPAYFEDRDCIAQFTHRIMIVRDPRDKAVSTTLFRALARRVDDEAALGDFIELLKQKEADPNSVSLLDVSRKADEFGIGKCNWDAIAESGQSQIEVMNEFPFHKVSYEDFVAGSHDALAEYLGLPLAGAEAGNAAWLGHITRTKSSGEWRNWFTEADVEFFRPLFKPYMDFFGYEDDWSLAEAPEVLSENASGYILRKHGRRTEHFDLFTSDETADIRNDEELAFFLGRGEDGSRKDILRLATHFSKLGKEDEAFYWYETGHLLGSNPCRQEMRAMLVAGFRPKQWRSQVAERRMAGKKIAAASAAKAG